MNVHFKYNFTPIIPAIFKLIRRKTQPPFFTLKIQPNTFLVSFKLKE